MDILYNIYKICLLLPHIPPHSFCHLFPCSLSTSISRSMKLATVLGCPTSSPAQLETCLQQADPRKIATKQYDTLPQPAFLALPFVPNVDGVFLPEEVEVGVCVCVCVCMWFFFFFFGMWMGRWVCGDVIRCECAY